MLCSSTLSFPRRRESMMVSLWMPACAGMTDSDSWQMPGILPLTTDYGPLTKVSLRLQRHHRKYHLLHRDASMLEAVAVMIEVVMILGRIDEVVVLLCYDIIDHHSTPWKLVV